MAYDDKYPEKDAHGRENKRITVIRLATGEEQTFIDDGFDRIDGQIFFHQQLDMLDGALKKKTKAGDPVFVVKDYKFPSGHPLFGNAVYDAAKHGAITEASRVARSAEQPQVEQFAKMAAQPFVDAATKKKADK